MNLSDLLVSQNPWWGDAASRRALLYPVRRDLEPQILDRIGRRDDRRAVLLLGPRQVGKTVLLLQLADDLLKAGLPAANLTYFDFSDDRITESLTIREIIAQQPVGLDADHPRVFLLDEVRLAASWDRGLKQAVDSGAGRIVATDSAASLLREGGRESGQGRWDELRIEGLSLSEFVRLHARPREDREAVLRRDPGLPERYLALGGFPEHAYSETTSEVWRRLRSDIADRAIVRDLSGLDVDVHRVKDLFVYLVQDSGGIFNASRRASDLGADERSVRKWIELLLDTYLLVRLEETSRSTKTPAVLRSRPKLYAADHALISAFATNPTEPTHRAKLFEAAVYRHLREAAASGERIGYFRSGQELEIDFVMETGGRVIGIEVTSSRGVRSDKVAKLRKAGERLGADSLLLIHGGLIDEQAEGVHAVTVGELLLDPQKHLAGVAT